MFIGRKAEIDTLHNQFANSRKTIILLYGRRRVGKTSLIREALKTVNDATVIYHEFHRVTPEQNIAEFSKSIGEALHIPSLPSFSSLSDAFSFINQIGKQTIIVMDEYSDLKMYAKKGEVDSYMRSIVDNLSENIILIITGSALKIMEELLEEGSLEVKHEDGYTRTVLTEKGKEAGIRADVRMSAKGNPYEVMMYSEKGQRHLVELMKKDERAKKK